MKIHVIISVLVAFLLIVAVIKMAKGLFWWIGLIVVVWAATSLWRKVW